MASATKEDELSLYSSEQHDAKSAPVVAVEFSVSTMLKLTMILYYKKLEADAVDEANFEVKQTLYDFVFDYFLFKFGIRHVAELHLKGLTESIKKHVDHYLRLRTFCLLCGIMADDNDVESPVDASFFLGRLLSLVWHLQGGGTYAMISTENAAVKLEILR